MCKTSPVRCSAPQQAGNKTAVNLCKGEAERLIATANRQQNSLQPM